MTMEVGQLIITHTDSHERGNALWNCWKESRGLQRLQKGFFERQWEKGIHSVEAWQILHQQGDGWQCKGIEPSSDGYGNGRPQPGLHAASCKCLFLLKTFLGIFDLL